MKFTEYCKQKGITLQPEDLKHINKCLRSIPKTQQKAVIKRYIDLWVHTMASCEKPLQAHNKGRRKANLYLLDVIDNF